MKPSKIFNNIFEYESLRQFGLNTLGLYHCSNDIGDIFFRNVILRIPLSGYNIGDKFEEAYFSFMSAKLHIYDMDRKRKTEVFNLTLELSSKILPFSVREPTK